MVIWIGIVVFACTNIDDLFVLLAFFADPSFRAREIVAGQYAGIAALIALSLMGAFCALAIPATFIGLLGLLPLGIGLRKLWGLWRGSEAADVDRQPAVAKTSKLFAVAAVTVANGGDNIGAYAPLFSTSTAVERGVLVAIFLGLTGLWCALAYALVSAPGLGRWIRRIGRSTLPCVLVGLGIYILVHNGALSLLPALRH